MSTESVEIRVSGLPVQIVRKDIKNLHLGVYPPNGRVRVAAPLRVSDEAVRMAVVTRLAWIKRQRAKFVGQERQSAREYLTGESHYFLGQRYRLNVVNRDGAAAVVIRNNRTIDLFVREGRDAEYRERVFLTWYRQQLKLMIPSLIRKWENIVGVKVRGWGVKKMKTKWGSCNSKTRRIWLNLELAKKPIQCLESIIVHEMVHLLERHHNDRFTALMDRFMPQWRLHREEMNRAPLSHEFWSY